MKRTPITWPAPRPGEKTYWRSLAELADTPEFREHVEREFPAGASELNSPISRRNFMTLMGASLALSGLSACRRPEEKILPYTRAPEHGVIGVPSYYATTATLGAEAIGILVESHEGRPTKIEGNPSHPLSLGATSQMVQAMILDLYDPERSAHPRLDGKEAGREAVLERLRERRMALLTRGGKGLRILSGTVLSPTVQRLRTELLSALPEARWHSYEPVCDDAIRAGSRLAFGQDLHMDLVLDHADLIVTLDADILGLMPDGLRNAREFARRRRVESKDDAMNRLYAVEAGWTITGASADHRLRVRPSEVPLVALQLALELSRLGLPLPAQVANALPREKSAGLDEKFIAAVARDLMGHVGRSVIAVGRSQPREVHALVHALNAGLQAVGTTVRYLPLADPDRPLDVASLGELTQSLDKGEVDTLVVLGSNPAYDAPADLEIERKLRERKDQIALVHLGLYHDETADLAQVHIPQAHFLEAWGDARATDGTVSMVQPLIAPLYDGISDVELVGFLASGTWTKGYELVRATWRGVAQAHMEQAAKERAAAAPQPPAGAPAPAKAAAAPKAAPAAPATGEQRAAPAATATPATAVAATASPFDLFFDREWRRTLHDGLMHGSGLPPVVPSLAVDKVAAALQAFRPAASSDGYEVHFPPSYSTYDGRFANNGWLQETPDPINKMVWDNAALLSPKTAQALGVEKDDIVEIGVRGRAVHAAVFIQPGQAERTVSLSLGYGRRRIGLVGRGAGFSAYTVRDSKALHYDGATMKKIGARYEDRRDEDVVDLVKITGLVTAQDHFALEGRPLLREASLTRFVKEPDFAKDPEHVTGKLKSLWDDPGYAVPGPGESPKKPLGQQWGMTIDLSACIGCGACSTACQAENNIPIVGKRQVRKGREMHWIRIDRYFSGDTENPDTAHQPVPCMQCENAPCENVCPVGATVHSSDGLNDMVYNRCVGTRYCSNNCPYKVRRFNFMDWRHDVPEVGKLKYNPDVTLRSRGVMEKCTYCVQRIRGAQQEATTKGHDKVADGTITPACAQVCPTEAIVFGDITDPQSRVSLLKKSHRNYEMLADLNTKPRTSYLARISNPNPDLRPESAQPEAGAHGAQHE